MTCRGWIIKCRQRKGFVEYERWREEGVLCRSAAGFDVGTSGEGIIIPYRLGFVNWA